MGILVLLNNTPISWYSKRQKTVESSTYGSELVASRIAVETLISLRYFISMLGCQLEPNSMLFGDNMVVVLNTTVPSSALKKKHQACNYHKVRESITAGFIKFAHIRSENNLADILTKPLPRMIYERLTSECLFRKAMAVKGQTSDNTGSPNASKKINPIMAFSTQAENNGLGLVDSGADTSLIGPEFYIETQYDNRRVNIEGFGGPSHSIRNMMIGNGVTAVDLHDRTVLLRVNEAVISAHKTVISTNQV